MTIDLKPAPVLQELIDDLETKICKLTTELAMLHSENGPRYLTYAIGWLFILTMFPAFFALLGFGTKSPFGRVKHIGKGK